jgi:hypothetical protein
MENKEVKKNWIIHPDLQRVFDYIKEKEYKIVDVLYDKMESTDEALSLQDINTSMVILSKKGPEFTAVLFSHNRKKAYRVFSLSLIGEALLNLRDDNSMTYSLTEEAAIEALDREMAAEYNNSKFRKIVTSLRHNGNNTDLGFGELLGKLVYEKGIPISKINKALKSVPEEAKSHLLYVVLFIVTYFSAYDLTAFIKYNRVLLEAVDEVTGLMITHTRLRNGARALYLEHSSILFRNIINKLDALNSKNLENVLDIVSVLYDGQYGKQTGADIEQRKN